MIANILIAIGAFVTGFVVGGVFVIRTSWNMIQNNHMKNKAKDDIIIKVYGV